MAPVLRPGQPAPVSSRRPRGLDGRRPRAAVDTTTPPPQPSPRVKGPELSSEPGLGRPRFPPDVRAGPERSRDEGADGLSLGRRYLADQFLFGLEVAHKPLKRGKGIADAALFLGDRTECDERVEQLLGSIAQTMETRRDRKSTRLNSSHRTISYAVFC